MEIVSNTLTASQLVGEISEIGNILNASGVDEVIVTLGWGAGLDINDLWKPIRLRVGELERYVHAKIEDGTFRAGNSDLFIEDETRSFEFLICHESDIHLSTKSENLVRRTEQRWMEAGYFDEGPRAVSPHS